MVKGHIFQFTFQDIPSFEPLPLQITLEGYVEVSILLNVHAVTTTQF